MKVLDFMNTHKNWEELLTQPPYNIKVKRDGDYVLLKYNQLNSDFNNEIVRECRGSIFFQNPDGAYICVCRAFDKFGNYGEAYVNDIDWNNAVVEEKIDGSLMKLWNHNGQWHLSTNGTIDAYSAKVGDTDKTFGDLFDEALIGIEGDIPFEYWLHPDNTYMFELVSPESRVTIPYPETKIYYLGQRNITTMRESKVEAEWMKNFGIACPKTYHLNSLNDCLEYVKTMTKDEEGFVIRDNNFNRMKLKSPEYLFAFHMHNNGAITTRRIIDMIKEENIDDFLAYCPEYKDKVVSVIKSISKIANHMELVWNNIGKTLATQNKKNYAELIKDLPYKDYLFKMYDKHDLTAIDYIMFQRTDKIKEMIEGM